MQLTSGACQATHKKQFCAAIARSPMLSADYCQGTVRSARWLPIDLFLEDAMDGFQVRATSAAETLAGTVSKILWLKS